MLGLVPHTPGTPLHPGAPSGNGPTPNFWTPSWALCSPTIQPLLFVSHLFSSPFSHCPLVPMSQYKPLPIRLTHICSPQMDAWPFKCTSPPITTHLLTIANATALCTLACSTLLLCLTPFLSWTMCLTFTYTYSYTVWNY
jgi:hypothetical protein